MRQVRWLGTKTKRHAQSPGLVGLGSHYIEWNVRANYAGDADACLRIHDRRETTAAIRPWRLPVKHDRARYAHTARARGARNLQAPRRIKTAQASADLVSADYCLISGPESPPTPPLSS